MNVGLVVESLDPRRGGVEQWTHQFAQRLLAGGHAVHVVARDMRLPPDAALPAFHRVSGAGRLDFAIAAEELLRRLPLDVIHDTGCGWHCDVFQPHGGSRTAAFEQNQRIEPAWLRPIKRLAAQWLPRYREFDRLARRQYAAPGRLFVAISQMVARDLQTWHGVPAERLRLVYNGVDTARFSPRHRQERRGPVRRQLGVHENETLLLTVAHNFRLKGVPTLLRAAALLAQRKCRVRVAIAGGKRLAGWQRWADRLGVGGLTTFLGPVDDPVPYYGAADVYIQPTFYDPCSLVVLEALASGLPAITSRFNGAGELIEPGREGEVIHDPADPRELADAIRPYCDRARQASAGQAARALAERHTLARNAMEMVAVYEQAAAKRKAA